MQMQNFLFGISKLRGRQKAATGGQCARPRKHELNPIQQMENVENEKREKQNCR